MDWGFGRDGGNRVPAEGRDLQTFEAGGNVRLGHGYADWNAVGHAFGGRNNVGRDFPLLDAEPAFAGASPAGLYFVGDEEAAVVFDDLEDDLEIFLGRRDESADALDRLR